MTIVRPLGQLVYNKHDVKGWSYSPNPNIVLSLKGVSWMQNEATFSNCWPSRSFAKFQYWPSHFLRHISTQQNTSHNCQKCHKIDTSMKICLHTPQICFYKRRPNLYVHEGQSVMPVTVWQSLCHVRTFIKLQPNYKKSSNLKQFVLFSNYYYFKYFQLWHIKAIFKTKISMHKYTKQSGNYLKI